jgi:hypothetical protein
MWLPKCGQVGTNTSTLVHKFDASSLRSHRFEDEDDDEDECD